MPLPTPQSGEDQSAFISRCMANPTARADFPDQKQRAAVCHSQFRKKSVWETIKGWIGKDKE